MDTEYLSNLIGSGAQADVYLYENKAIKVFKTDFLEADALYEAKFQDQAQKMGLPVPAIYEVTAIQDQMAIVMEYVEGPTPGSLMLNDMANAIDYLNIAADLQLQVHRVKTTDFPLLRINCPKK